MAAPYRLLGSLLLGLAVPSQAQEPQAPKASAGVMQLGYYVGSWQGHGEIGGQKLASNFTCEWFTGGYQVVCRGEESGPTGKRAFINIKSFDDATNSYTEYSASSMGETEYSRGGKLIGSKMIYFIDQGTAVKPSKIRYTETRSSSDKMTYQAEISENGGPWTGMARGEIKKIGP